MPIEVTMPKLSDSMEEGRIVRWLKQEGDTLHEGDVLVEIESDKAVMELESFYAGTLARILHREEAIVRVGEVIALVAEPGEALPPERAAAAAPVPPAAATGPAKPPAGVRPSPPAREGDLDRAAVQGAAPAGRLASPGRPPAGPAPVPKPPPDEEIPEIRFSPDEADVEPVSFNQLAVIRHVTASKHVIPHFYVTTAVVAERLLALKEAQKAALQASVTHYIMRAAALALRQHPGLHVSYDRGRVIRWKKLNIGLAVEAEKGLVVAVVRDCWDLPLAALAARTRALVAKARAGQLSPPERQNPTFVISNMGMYEVESFQAIITPPAATVLAVGSALRMPVAVGDAMKVAPVMRLTLSCDHRIINGSQSAAFLAEMKRLLENPESLL